MPAEITVGHAAIAIALEAGSWRQAANFQWRSQDIGFRFRGHAVFLQNFFDVKSYP
jgi:hypothetical protein